MLLSRTREIPSTFIAKVTVERGDEVMLWKVETKSDSARRSLGKALISWASIRNSLPSRYVQVRSRPRLFWDLAE